MTDERQLHMQKAVRFLRSVNRRAASDEPEAVTSTAYYAMHHAACAVLLHRGKKLPKTHSSLIGLFGLVVRDLGPAGREAGAALHNVFETRSTGDYSAAVRLSRADALAARDAAQDFVSLLPDTAEKVAAARQEGLKHAGSS